MSELTPDVSVVVPLLDGEQTVAELVGRVCAVLDEQPGSFELVILDDGSRDATAARLREIEAVEPRLRVFELTRNFGQAAALACGIFHARGRVVVTMDGDLQNPPEELPKLLGAVAKGASIVTARRAERHERTWRWLGSRAIHALARRLTGAEIRDFGGQFKAYRRDVVEAMRPVWAAGKPLLPLALSLGFAAEEVDVAHAPRAAGRSRYRFGALVGVAVEIVTSFTTAPLLLLGAVGVAGVGLALVGLALCFWLDPAGWLLPATCLAILVVSGVWCAVGTVGVYLARVYEQSLRIAPYVVRRGPARESGAVPAAGARAD